VSKNEPWGQPYRSFYKRSRLDVTISCLVLKSNACLMHGQAYSSFAIFLFARPMVKMFKVRVGHSQNILRSTYESLSVFLARPFQPSLIFVGKARRVPYSGVPERCLTWVGLSLTCKYYIRLERSARDKHTSLLRSFINYGCKKFYNIGTWSCMIRDLLLKWYLHLQSF
jgi:hypothetical protein